MSDVFCPIIVDQTRLRQNVTPGWLNPLYNVQSKLCLSQGNKEASSQRFSVALHSMEIPHHEVATLNITLTYRCKLLQAAASSVSQLLHEDNVGTAQQSTLRVQVLRGTGLQQAALSAAATTSQQAIALRYAAAVGLNAYCRFRLSFQRDVERVTKSIARTFTPHWGHCSELGLALLWPRHGGVGGGDNVSGFVSLMELLEEGYLQVQVWHKSPAAVLQRNLGAQLRGESLLEASSRYEDILLGTLNMPLRALLSSTRLHGWFPLDFPAELSMEKREFLPSCVGGVELCVSWAHTDNREKVLEAARRAGYTSLHLSFEAST